jgi:hypothetical protein
LTDWNFLPAQLQLPALQGTDAQKDKCKRLGWALVGLYQDLATGEDIKYNEGCAEEDLWMTGIGYEDPATEKVVCTKYKRTADMDINWHTFSKVLSDDVVHEVYIVTLFSKNSQKLMIFCLLLLLLGNNSEKRICPEDTYPEGGGDLGGREGRWEIGN